MLVEQGSKARADFDAYGDGPGQRRLTVLAIGW
jgi:hypothetical protein